MIKVVTKLILTFVVWQVLIVPANAHRLRATGVPTPVAGTFMQVTPDTDWNSLSHRSSPNVEKWTIDGEQLNDLTFYGGIPAGSTLLKDRNKKREPLPKFTQNTLIIEIPELLDRTYRTAKSVRDFTLLDVNSVRFLGADGVRFRYDFIDDNELTRRGEAYAAIISGKLYMITFDAPRLGFFQRNVLAVQTLVSSAKLTK